MYAHLSERGIPTSPLTLFSYAIWPHSATHCYTLLHPTATRSSSSSSNCSSQNQTATHKLVQFGKPPQHPGGPLHIAALAILDPFLSTSLPTHCSPLLIPSLPIHVTIHSLPTATHSIPSYPRHYPLTAHCYSFHPFLSTSLPTHCSLLLIPSLPIHVTTHSLPTATHSIPSYPRHYPLTAHCYSFHPFRSTSLPTHCPLLLIPSLPIHVTTHSLPTATHSIPSYPRHHPLTAHCYSFHSFLSTSLPTHCPLLLIPSLPIHVTTHSLPTATHSIPSYPRHYPLTAHRYSFHPFLSTSLPTHCSLLLIPSLLIHVTTHSLPTATHSIPSYPRHYPLTAHCYSFHPFLSTSLPTHCPLLLIPSLPIHVTTHSLLTATHSIPSYPRHYPLTAHCYSFHPFLSTSLPTHCPLLLIPSLPVHVTTHSLLTATHSIPSYPRHYPLTAHCYSFHSFLSTSLPTHCPLLLIPSLPIHVTTHSLPTATHSIPSYPRHYPLTAHCYSFHPFLSTSLPTHCSLLLIPSLPIHVTTHSLPTATHSIPSYPRHYPLTAHRYSFHSFLSTSLPTHCSLLLIPSLPIHVTTHSLPTTTHSIPSYPRHYPLTAHCYSFHSFLSTSLPTHCPLLLIPSLPIHVTTHSLLTATHSIPSYPRHYPLTAHCYSFHPFLSTSLPTHCSLLLIPFLPIHVTTHSLPTATHPIPSDPRHYPLTAHRYSFHPFLSTSLPTHCSLLLIPSLPIHVTTHSLLTATHSIPSYPRHYPLTAHCYSFHPFLSTSLPTHCSLLLIPFLPIHVTTHSLLTATHSIPSYPRHYPLTAHCYSFHSFLPTSLPTHCSLLLIPSLPIHVTTHSLPTATHSIPSYPRHYPLTAHRYSFHPFLSTSLPTHCPLLLIPSLPIHVTTHSLPTATHSIPSYPRHYPLTAHRYSCHPFLSTSLPTHCPLLLIPSLPIRVTTHSLLTATHSIPSYPRHYPLTAHCYSFHPFLSTSLPTHCPLLLIPFLPIHVTTHSLLTATHSIPSYPRHYPLTAHCYSFHPFRSTSLPTHCSPLLIPSLPIHVTTHSLPTATHSIPSYPRHYPLTAHRYSFHPFLSTSLPTHSSPLLIPSLPIHVTTHSLPTATHSIPSYTRHYPLTAHCYSCHSFLSTSLPTHCSLLLIPSLPIHVTTHSLPTATHSIPSYPRHYPLTAHRYSFHPFLSTSLPTHCSLLLIPSLPIHATTHSLLTATHSIPSYPRHYPLTAHCYSFHPFLSTSLPTHCPLLLIPSLPIHVTTHSLPTATHSIPSYPRHYPLTAHCYSFHPFLSTSLPTHCSLLLIPSLPIHVTTHSLLTATHSIPSYPRHYPLTAHCYSFHPFLSTSLPTHCSLLLIPSLPIHVTTHSLPTATHSIPSDPRHYPLTAHRYSFHPFLSTSLPTHCPLLLIPSLPIHVTTHSLLTATHSIPSYPRHYPLTPHRYSFHPFLSTSLPTHCPLLLIPSLPIHVTTHSLLTATHAIPSYPRHYPLTAHCYSFHPFLSTSQPTHCPLLLIPSLPIHVTTHSLLTATHSIPSYPRHYPLTAHCYSFHPFLSTPLPTHCSPLLIPFLPIHVTTHSLLTATHSIPSYPRHYPLTAHCYSFHPFLSTSLPTHCPLLLIPSLPIHVTTHSLPTATHSIPSYPRHYPLTAHCYSFHPFLSTSLPTHCSLLLIPSLPIHVTTHSLLTATHSIPSYPRHYPLTAHRYSFHSFLSTSLPTHCPLLLIPSLPIHVTTHSLPTATHSIPSYPRHYPLPLLTILDSFLSTSFPISNPTLDQKNADVCNAKEVE